MPEGPEVKTFAVSLDKKFSGKVLISLRQNPSFRYDLSKLINKFPLRLKSVNSHGKKLYFEFERENFLLVSLGLEGSFSFESKKNELLSFLWGERSSDNFLKVCEVLIFSDTRRFSIFEFFDSKEKLNLRLSKLGFDLLGENPPTVEAWKNLFEKSKTRDQSTIAEYLLKQEKICSIGNYLRAEILYEAKISPFRKVAELTDSEIETLYYISLDLTQKAYLSRGATLRTYSDLWGEKGNFEVKIYGKKTDPYGNKIKTSQDRNGRTIWYSPKVQI